MRVIAGAARGRNLKTLQGLATRPTADRVKESLFNILGQDLCGVTFLDLFAGSGAVGIEAISRGAVLSVFVDNAPLACRIIRENLEVLGFSDRAEIHCREAAGALEIAGKKGRKFDIVFSDPPYEKGLARRSLTKLGEAGVVSLGGLCVIEHSRREALPLKAEDLELYRSETYGDTVLSFFRRPEPKDTAEEKH